MALKGLSDGFENSNAVYVSCCIYRTIEITCIGNNVILNKNDMAMGVT